MNKTIYKSFNGKCPITKAEQCITAKYKGIQSLGQNSVIYKLLTASCDAIDSVNCTYGDNCPILNEIPDVSYE